MRERLIKYKRTARRVARVRKNIFGTPERPRLAVSRSLQNITAQIIDDLNGRTLASASTAAKDRNGYGGNKQAAVEIGKRIGEKAKSMGIEKVCFDRRGRKYHGRVKAVADAAREAGLQF